MNKIVLRGKPGKRILVAATIAVAMAVLLFPAFVQFDCDTGNLFKCVIYKYAAPYLGLLMPFIFVPYRRFLLGKPVVTLTREGVESGLRPTSLISWAQIEEAEITRIHHAKMLAIRLKAGTVPPPQSFLGRMFASVFFPNARTHLYVSQMHIDRPLQHLKHWVDEGRRNAAVGAAPDPFFTAP